jgi:hypothetical protein
VIRNTISKLNTKVDEIEFEEVENNLMVLDIANSTIDSSLSSTSIATAVRIMKILQVPIKFFKKYKIPTQNIRKF